jgi:hypothetical protein
MTVNTSAGTTVQISASTPATFDSAGYAALSFTTVGEITNIGDFGREFAKIEHKPVGSRGKSKRKGSFDEGTMDFDLGLDTDDAGQILMKAAALSDSDYSFVVNMPTGDKYYFQGLVMKFKVGIKGVDDITSATTQIELQSNSAGVGIVEVLA